MTATLDLPELALSVRQPWAWAIIHGGKDVENRGWKRSNPGLDFRGPVCIHASSGMTRAEYDEAAGFMEYEVSWRVDSLPPAPSACDLVRGALIGTVDVVDVVRRSESPWFVGPVGLVLANPRPIEPTPCRGQLGFFRWQRGGVIASTARWMQPPSATAAADPHEPAPDLFGKDQTR